MLASLNYKLSPDAKLALGEYIPLRERNPCSRTRVRSATRWTGRACARPTASLRRAIAS